MSRGAPLVGIGYRQPIGEWIRDRLDLFDVLEITVDHYLYGGAHIRVAIEAIARRVPIVAHGVGLSLGTDRPLDEPYVREVAQVVRILGALRYSEHLSFTKVPGLDLANLLPLPKTPEVAADIAAKVRRLRELMPVPFDLENITYLFDWPHAQLSDAAFLRSVCEAGGAGILLDVENLHVNATNHALDPEAELSAIPAELVRGFHMAGGCREGEVLIDSHDHALREGAVGLLVRALRSFRPDTIVLERDDRIEAVDEILADVARIRACLAAADYSAPEAQPAAAPPPVLRRPVPQPAPVPLIERQRVLLGVLANPFATFDHPALDGLDPDRLRLMRALSVGKRMEKVQSVFPVTLAHLDVPFESLSAAFAATFPPHDIGRVENATQFRDFLVARASRAAAQRAYLLDLAGIELAVARARRAAAVGFAAPAPGARPAVRCHAGAQFLECRHDVRALFDPATAAEAPVARDVRLVVLPPAPDESHGEPRVLEIAAPLHAALQELDGWRPLTGDDPLGIGAPAGLTEQLHELGLLEIAA